MANEYLTKWGFINGSDTNLRRRAVVAILKARADIINEDPGTANHANRIIWAESIQLPVQAATMADKMMLDVLSNATIFADPDQSASADPDGDIQFVVNSLLSVAANVANYNA